MIYVLQIDPTKHTVSAPQKKPHLNFLSYYQLNAKG